MKDFKEIVLSIAFLFVLAFPLVASDVDSLNAVVHDTYGDEKLQAKASLSIALAVDNPDSAIALANEVLSVSRWNQIRIKGLCYLGLGEAAYYKDDYPNALINYRRSFDLFQKLADTSGMANITNSLGLVYYYQAMYDSAMMAFQSSLQYETAVNNLVGIAKSHQNLGLVVYQLGETEKFFEHMYDALEIYEKLQHDRFVAEVSNNIAVAYASEGNFEKSHKLYQKALFSFEREGDELNKANVLNNIGGLYFRQGKYKEAMEQLYLALPIFERLKNTQGLIHIHSRLGDVYHAFNNNEQAISEYLRCEELNQKVNIRDLRASNLQSLTKAYKAIGDYENALRVSDEYHAIKDSIYNDEKYKAILEIEKAFEIEKHETELKELESRAKIRTLIMAIMGIVAFSGVLILLLWLRQKQTKEKQRLVALEQKVLRSQLSPNFLFNGLSTVQYYVLEGKTVEAIDFIGDFSKLLRMMLQCSQEEYIPLQTEKNILDFYLGIFSKRYDNRLSFLIHIDEKIDLNKTLIPPMLALPFIENAIEYGELVTVEDGHIWISFSMEEDRIKYRIQDNGSGINKAGESSKRTLNHSIACNLTIERIRLINIGEKNSQVEFIAEDLSKYGKTGTLIEFSIPFHTLS